MLVVEGAAPTEQPPMTVEEAEALAREYLAQGMSPSEAAKTAAAETGLKKGDIYRRIID